MAPPGGRRASSVWHEFCGAALTCADRSGAPLESAKFWDDRTIFLRIKGTPATLLMTRRLSFGFDVGGRRLPPAMLQASSPDLEFGDNPLKRW
jgi:hypothetical protein